MTFGALNTLFSVRVLDALATDGYHPAFECAAREYVPNRDGLTNGDVLEALYRYMKRNHRNEYVYKSVLLKKLVFGIHSPRTSTALCELPVAGSIADFVIVNGKAVAYEVKTELDNYARLDDQIESYFKAFRYVNILCSERAYEDLIPLYADSPVGICVLTARGNVSVRKKCFEFTEGLDRAVQFGLLRKAEREGVITSCGFALPAVGDAYYYQSCLELFRRIPETEFNIAFLRELKGRGASINLEALSQYPEEFKLIAYTHRASSHQARSLRSFLMAPCRVV